MSSSRRQVLTLALAGLVQRFLTACGATNPPAPLGLRRSPASPSAAAATGGTTGGPPCTPTATCPAPSGAFSVSIADNPGLGQPGGWTVVEDPSFVDTVCGMSSVVVAQVAQGQFIALSASCPHLCCEVAFVPGVGSASGSLQCPCHGSEFDLNGNVLQGPATKPLQQLSACFDGCNVVITPSKT